MRGIIKKIIFLKNCVWKSESGKSWIRGNGLGGLDSVAWRMERGFKIIFKKIILYHKLKN